MCSLCCHHCSSRKQGFLLNASDVLNCNLVVFYDQWHVTRSVSLMSNFPMFFFSTTNSHLLIGLNKCFTFKISSRHVATNQFTRAHGCITCLISRKRSCKVNLANSTPVVVSFTIFFSLDSKSPPVSSTLSFIKSSYHPQNFVSVNLPMIIYISDLN